MSILIVTPAARPSRSGNRVTADRWARLLRQAGHRVKIATRYASQPARLLIALHARKSAPSIRAFRDQRPECPLVVAMTGTDLYQDLPASDVARASLRSADRIVLLQPDGLRRLPANVRDKTRVIYQSCPPPRKRPPRRRDRFEICVAGHLRPVKDPFRTALAVRRLPAESRAVVLHLGEALTQSMQRRAHTEAARNPRYKYLGPQPRWKTRLLIARSRVLVVSSKSEGGANVVSEALAARVPVVSSRISGSLGLLGEDYPGYFKTGDTAALTRLLWRCESDRAFYRSLTAACAAKRPLIDPRREQRALQQLVRELQQ